MNTILAYAKAYIMAYIVAPVLGLFDRGLDGIIADANKLNRKIDTFLDREGDRRVALLQKRQALRERIDAAWAEFNASAEDADFASSLKSKTK